MKPAISRKIDRILCLILGACGTFGLLSNHLVMAADSVSLHSAKPDGSAIHVTAKLEVGGNLQFATDNSDAKSKDQTADKKGTDTQAVPMSVVAQFAYDEQRLDDGNSPAHRMSVRYYDDAQAVIKIASKITKPQLRDNRKVITAIANQQSAYLSSPNGPLTRDELELIDIPASTLTLDQLLPQSDVEIGHRWKPSDDALAKFLCLDSVGHTEVEAVLANVKDGVAEITFEGPLGGAIDGAATEIELKGKLLFDTKLQLPKTLLLAIKEKRELGHVGPGLDIVAKLKVNIAPQPDSKSLTAYTLQAAKLPQADIGAAGPPLEYISQPNGFHFVYDRHWHLTRDDSDLLVMRLIEHGDLVGQCNVAASAIAADKPLELTEFQTDVQQALGKMFGKFDHAKEDNTPSGLRVLQSTAEGAADSLPIEWRYYLVHDKQGHAVTLIFTMESSDAEQFQDQDMPIVNSVEFIDAKVARR